MKNIAYSLIMTFLFGTFFPSYQAYANGKKNIEFSKTYNYSILNEDLVDKLANSKTFEKFYNLTYMFSAYSVSMLSHKSNEELELLKLKAIELENKNGLSASDTIEIYKLFGYENSERILGFEANMNKLMTNLKNQFPDFARLNKIEAKEVIEKAIYKGDFATKAALLFDMDQCYDDANKSYSKCMSNTFWAEVILVATCAICIGAVVACLYVAAATTAGAAAVAFAAQLLPLAKTCVQTLSKAILGVAASGTVTCDTSYHFKISACAQLYGIPPNGAQ